MQAIPNPSKDGLKTWINRVFLSTMGWGRKEQGTAHPYEPVHGKKGRLRGDPKIHRTGGRWKYHTSSKLEENAAVLQAHVGKRKTLGYQTQHPPGELRVWPAPWSQWHWRKKSEKRPRKVRGVQGWLGQDPETPGGTARGEKKEWRYRCPTLRCTGMSLQDSEDTRKTQTSLLPQFHNLGDMN